MCGIAGKFYFDKSLFHEEDFDNILRSIIHRGPDSEGRYCDGRVIIGFRRLSIIDTVTGDQPLYSENGEIILIANGEIYNHLELRRLLRDKGHRFRTKSDCEVLVHLYEEFGVGFVEKLNGMFAFCLYDKRREKLFLGRDRVGIKPLYVANPEGVIVFASEIKAILQATEVSLVENQDVLEEYLCFRYLSGTRTFFSGIDLLPPGSLLEISPTGLKTRRYWQPVFHLGMGGQTDTVRSIQDTLQRSINRQLMADVPLGTQLSGGLDSSWVSILAARKAPGMKSFSVGFSEVGFDETREAKDVATRAGLEYHQITSSPDTFRAMLPHIIWHNDEPLAHANSVEIFNLCRFAKDHVKVLLTGEGADELFGGYPRYFLSQLAETYKHLHPIFRPAFGFGLDWFSRGRGKKPSRFLGMSPRELVYWNSAFAPQEKIAWLTDRDVLDCTERRELLDKIWLEDLDPMDNLLLFEYQSYLQPILLRQDKMSMGVSIEARVPILDNEMVDLAFSITATEKMKYLKPKYLFKKAAIKDLPYRIVNKRKVGFGVPVGTWMRKNGSLSVFLEQLCDQRRNLQGVNPVKLEHIINEQREGLNDHQDILWPLLNYVLWKDIYFYDRSCLYE